MVRGDHFRQTELVLPPPSAEEVLSDRLADTVERLNATTHSGERVELYHEIQRLRRLLGMERAP